MHGMVLYSTRWRAARGQLERDKDPRTTTQVLDATRRVIVSHKFEAPKKGVDFNQRFERAFKIGAKLDTRTF